MLWVNICLKQGLVPKVAVVGRRDELDKLPHTEPSATLRQVPAPTWTTSGKGQMNMDLIVNRGFSNEP